MAMPDRQLTVGHPLRSCISLLSGLRWKPEEGQDRLILIAHPAQMRVQVRSFRLRFLNVPPINSATSVQNGTL
jgi:hypothetical protein